MIETRTREGDATALAALVQSAWRRTYEGRMAFPLRGSDCIGWQLMADQFAMRMHPSFPIGMPLRRRQP